MSSGRKKCFIPMALSVALLCQASGPGWTLSEPGPPPPEASGSSPKGETSRGNTPRFHVLPVPLASYKDTYGFIGGVGLVLYDPHTQTRFSASANTNFDEYFKYRMRFEWIKPEVWILDADGYLGNDLQAYYGEGDDTPLRHVTHKSTLNGSKITALIHSGDNLYIGPSFEYRFRKWDEDGVWDPAVFGNESEWRIGLQNRWEGRDNIVEPSRGHFAELDVYALPKSGENGLGAGVLQVEGDWRGYRPLWRDGILAVRVNAGNSWGNPSYSYRRALGGTVQLRGFKSNRFRGKRFYVAQAETRIRVWRWFGVDTGFDLGDVTDGRLGAPQWSYQAGLKTDLLAKFGLVVRVDWGWSKDSRNFFFNTFEPF